MRHMTVPGISAILPTYHRLNSLRSTINRLKDCVPPPNEILVHVDGQDIETTQWLATTHPDVIVLVSRQPIGPGAGRNRLIRAANHELVASFDDDSWPIDPDFFDRARSILMGNPQVSLIACHIIESDTQQGAVKTTSGGSMPLMESAAFVGCGCVFRRRDLIQAGTYLPTTIAYGIEETDMTLRLLDIDKTIAQCAELAVFHDSDRQTRHRARRINAAHITNIGLLAFLRYPIDYWPYGCLQVLNRVKFCVQARRYSGILTGLFGIPVAVYKNRKLRTSVDRRTLQRYFEIRRDPKPVGSPNSPITPSGAVSALRTRV
jgi:glycosyltransferase involved in cell wall biosynthesis